MARRWLAQARVGEMRVYACAGKHDWATVERRWDRAAAKRARGRRGFMDQLQPACNLHGAGTEAVHHTNLHFAWTLSLMQSWPVPGSS